MSAFTLNAVASICINDQFIDKLLDHPKFAARLRVQQQQIFEAVDAQLERLTNLYNSHLQHMTNDFSCALQNQKTQITQHFESQLHDQTQTLSSKYQFQLQQISAAHDKSVQESSNESCNTRHTVASINVNPASSPCLASYAVQNDNEHCQKSAEIQFETIDLLDCDETQSEIEEQNQSIKTSNKINKINKINKEVKRKAVTHLTDGKQSRDSKKRRIQTNSNKNNKKELSERLTRHGLPVIYKPGTSWMFFLKSVADSGMSLEEKSVMWKTMTHPQKYVYDEQARNAMAQYTQNISKLNDRDNWQTRSTQQEESVQSDSIAFNLTNTSDLSWTQNPTMDQNRPLSTVLSSSHSVNLHSIPSQSVPNAEVNHCLSHIVVKKEI